MKNTLRGCGGTRWDSLSETQIKAAKPGPKEFFLNDGDNLFLRVRSSGKAWIYRYEKDVKTVKLGMGPYPSTMDTSQTRCCADNEVPIRHPFQQNR